LVLFPDYGRYKCYACGERGDTIDLVRHVLGVSFKEAVAWIQRQASGSGSLTGKPMLAGQSVSRPGPASPSAAALEVYQALFNLTLPPEPATVAGAYLKSRHLDPALAASLGAREIYHLADVWFKLLGQLGEDKIRAAGLLTSNGNFLFTNHHLLFFYFDGNVPVYVQGRDVTGTATAKELSPVGGIPCPVPFNGNILQSPLQRVFVCEGAVDALSAVQMGYLAVGVPGVQGFRDDWFALFRGCQEICVLFDNDEVGRRQGAELRARFRQRSFRAEAYRVPQGKDVNDYLVLSKKGEKS
jgi:DNA primase